MERRGAGALPPAPPAPRRSSTARPPDAMRQKEDKAGRRARGTGPASAGWYPRLSPSDASTA
jgi:hypothetical protein